MVETGSKGIVSESCVMSIYLFVCCVQSQLDLLLIASWIFMAYRMYLTPHCLLTSLLRTLDDLVLVILFLLTSKLALGRLSFFPMASLATTSSHMHTHTQTHTHFKSWKCLLLEDLLFALDLTFLLSIWRKPLQEGIREISRPYKVIVLRRQKWYGVFFFFD